MPVARLSVLLFAAALSPLALSETIVVPIDPSAGASQQYVEDCPVCCSANEVFVDFDDQGIARVTSRLE